jgi:hemoglobin
MRRLTFLFAAFAVTALPVAAQEATPAGEQAVAPYTMSNANAGATPMRDARVFNQFHGMEGVHRVVDRTINASVADPRIAEIFVNQDIVRLKRTLAEQICYLVGGPCAYSGRDMATAHANMGIQTRDFNVLVEHLEDAMRAERVPIGAQHQLLALLAPMHRTIVAH